MQDVKRPVHRAVRKSDKLSNGAARGQGMTEYIVIVALIAVAAIGTYSLLGQTVRNQTAGLALEISGKAGRAAITAAGTNATQAQAKANKKKGLANYDEGNTQ